MNIAYNIDCMEYMKTIPDKYFDLAVVDPPYGGGADEQNSAELHGGGGTVIGKLPTQRKEEDSAEILTATISANRTGGTWATKYRQR